MDKEALSQLLKKDLIIGYVYGLDGECQQYYFEKSLGRDTAKLLELLRGLDQLGVELYSPLEGQIQLDYQSPSLSLQ